VRKGVIFVVLMMILSMGFLGCTPRTGAIQGEENVKYTLFIGLNDKDTYEQEIPSEEAERIMTDIALKYVDGFTVHSARGTYKDEKGVITNENSLVVEVSNASEQQIKDIMDEILEELNQNSILLEKQRINSEFYEGEKS